MKQLIVLISTIVLGVSLSGVIMGMGGDAQGLSDATEQAMINALTSGTAIEYTVSK